MVVSFGIMAFTIPRTLHNSSRKYLGLENHVIMEARVLWQEGGCREAMNVIIVRIMLSQTDGS